MNKLVIYMVSLKEKFEFMDDGIDIPFYNGTPKLSTVEWGLVLASILLTIGYLTVIRIPGEYLPVAIFLTSVIPALYICKGNYNIFFKKPKLRDIKIIILCLIGIYIYTIAIGFILQNLVGNMAAHASTNDPASLMTLIIMCIQLMGEEFFKILLLLLIMFVLYKYTNNRSISLFVGLILSMAIFGLVHYNAYSSRIIQILFIQGFGAIFEYYAFLKTKNVWISYIIHVLRDSIPELVKMIGY